jgi:hypothetical protein
MLRQGGGCAMTTVPALRQIRVHGVGGPQAPKILGVLGESDVETLPARPAPGAPGVTGIFADGGSRLAIPLGSTEVGAYEWGGLTLGSILNALWVVYLPLTFLNAAGWSRHRDGGRANRWLASLLCGLGTLTYVGWIGYILLDLIGRQWRDRLVVAAVPRLLADAVRCAGLPLAHVLFAAILGTLWWVNRRSGKRFEAVSLGDPVKTWGECDDVGDPSFFGHDTEYRRLRVHHEAVAVLGAVAVVLLGFIPRTVPGSGGSLTSIGLVLVLLAVVQGLIVLLLWVSCLGKGSVPQCVFATIGTLLCHAAFAGAAITLRSRLSAWPKDPDRVRPVVSGAELGSADLFFLALIAAAVVLVGSVVIVASSRRAVPGYPVADRPHLATALVRRATAAGTIVSLSFVVGLTIVVVIKLSGFGLHANPTTWWASTIAWYERYVSRQNAAQKLGGLALTGIVVVVVVVLRRPRTSGPGRIVGNVWDVLTFWPRRFHPFAVPPYSERAVPELRWVVRECRDPSRPLVLVGHSQGSVLAFVAAAQELAVAPDAGPVSMLTFGSPLGTLYSQAFPDYFGPENRTRVAGALGASGGRWWNVYRSTDPIGGPVLGGAPQTTAWFDKWVPDPRGPVIPRDIPPPPRALERPQPWFARNGHGFYPADPAVRQMLVWLRDGTTVPTWALRVLDAYSQAEGGIGR